MGLSIMEANAVDTARAAISSAWRDQERVDWTKLDDALCRLVNDCRPDPLLVAQAVDRAVAELAAAFDQALTEGRLDFREVRDVVERVVADLS